MEERYIRNLGALTAAECALLRGKRVFVAGCGGLGGYIIDMLLRIGLGGVTVADGDRFEASNLNRQLLADVDTLGKSKALTAAAYAVRVNPDVDFTAIDSFVSSDNAAKLISGCDAVMDALDSAGARKMLALACRAAGVPFIHGAVCGWTVQTAAVMPGDSAMDILYPPGAKPADMSSPAFTPALCASLQTALCVKLLCGRPVERGRIYFFDMLDNELTSI